MSRPISVNAVARLIECLLPRDVSEVVVGDLFEEFALRSQSARQSGAVNWFVLQAIRSVPRLLLLSVRRWSWLKSLSAALLAFMALERIEPAVRRWLAGNFDPSLTQQIVLSLFIGFAACACGGFLSTWMHRGSALLYSAIGTSFLVASIMSVDTTEPTWFLTSFVVIAVLAPIVGGVGFVTVANEWQRRRRS